MIWSETLRTRLVELGLGFLIALMLTSSGVESRCSRGCDALASYYTSDGTNLTFISELFDDTPINSILNSNPPFPNQDYLVSGTRLNVPFRCYCINEEFLGHVFTYSVRPGNTYDIVANLYYANLTTVDWLQRFNIYAPERVPDELAYLNVTVNCSCGDQNVSKDYGLFITYPLRPDDSLISIAQNFYLSSDLIQRYNPNTDFNSGSGLVYIPGRGISTGAITGISIAGIAAALFVAVSIYVAIFRKKKVEASLVQSAPKKKSNQHRQGFGSPLKRTSDSAGAVGGTSPVLTGITVEYSVEFFYEELAQATNDFSLANKIGQGGFGAVYFAELRGEKTAIKKMDMQASKEFRAELKVLTHVHHFNLVRLIGYCVEGSLFLVYEFIENGNLSEHLRGSGREPLPWPTRVQIALDSARGLEYIHEHTVPVYIHRDIKSANILIDKNFHGKVADFGLAKLMEVGSSTQTRLVGTFGYMPPEYAQSGYVSPKVDVYAFGVVLYELISAKGAVVMEYGSSAYSTGLVALFDAALSHPDPGEDFKKLVDPRLGENYPFDSVVKMAQLAKACTHEKAQIRPSMRSIVVALRTLLSPTEDWDSSLYENQALMNQVLLM